MKICMITSSLEIGGAETHIISLTEALLSRGHRVTVVSAGGLLVPKDSQATFITLPLNKKRHMLSCIRALRRLFRREGFDVIHAHARFPAFLAKRAGAFPLVTTAHFPFSVAFPLRTLSVWGDKTLAVSPDIADYLQREYRLLPEKITVTRNGIDTSLFAPTANAAKRQGFHIVHASRLDKDRSLAAFCLLEALRLWEREDVFLHIIGDGEDYGALEAEATLFNANAGKPRVLLYGRQRDLVPYLQGADCFVGVSRAALEAMSCALPVILAGNEGFLSVFHRGLAAEAEKSNLCCRGAAVLTPHLLLEALKQVAALTEEKRQESGLENRRYVCEGYSLARMAEDAEAVYLTVSGDKKEAVLCGYYGFGNGGDEWMRYALYKRLEREGYFPIHLLSRRYATRRAWGGVRRGADFFLGGGNLLQDETSSRSLWFYTACVALAKKRGASVFLLSAGVGPLSERGKRRATAALQGCRRIEARTERDAAVFAALAPECPVFLAYDAALAYPFAEAEREGALLLLVLQRPPHSSEYALLSSIASLLQGESTLSPRLISLHPADAAFCKQAGRRLGLSEEAVITADGEAALPLLLPCAKLVLSNRLHAGVAALAAGVPSFLFPQSEKISAFSEDVSRVAREMALPSPVRLLPFSFSRLPSDTLEKEDILRLKGRLLGRCRLFSPFSTQE